MKQIQVGATVVNAVTVQPVQATEPWNEYLLDDGTVLRIRCVAVEILRLEGQFNDVGDPQYYVRTNQLVVTTQCPQEIRKPINAGG